MFNCKITTFMSICKILPLEGEISTSTYLYGDVKVCCRVIARPRSVIVHILDARFNRFRTRRFIESTFSGIDKFDALLNSVKDEPFEFQSFFIAHVIARVAIESLGANELLKLYSTFLILK